MEPDRIRLTLRASIQESAGAGGRWAVKILSMIHDDFLAHDDKRR
jgi:hypothetical protein